MGRDERRVILFVEEDHRKDPAVQAHTLAATYKVPPTTFEVRVVDAFPLTANGKVDYHALEQDAA